MRDYCFIHNRFSLSCSCVLLSFTVSQLLHATKIAAQLLNCTKSPPSLFVYCNYHTMRIAFIRFYLINKGEEDGYKNYKNDCWYLPLDRQRCGGKNELREKYNHRNNNSSVFEQPQQQQHRTIWANGNRMFYAYAQSHSQPIKTNGNGYTSECSDNECMWNFCMNFHSLDSMLTVICSNNNSSDDDIRKKIVTIN